jgi:hypothetical protein
MKQTRTVGRLSINSPPTWADCSGCKQAGAAGKPAVPAEMMGSKNE